MTLLKTNNKSIEKLLIEFIYNWIYHFYFIDFTSKLTNNLINLLKSNFISLEESKNKLKLLLIKVNKEKLFPKKNRISSCTFTNTYLDFDLFSMSPMDIAKALTIIEKNNFDSIKISHIIQKFSLLHATQLLNDIQPAASEPETILQCINHFNDVSNWVTSEILLRVGKEKEQCLKKFIQIAKACYQIGNFNSMMEVISGFKFFLFEVNYYKKE